MAYAAKTASPSSPARKASPGEPLLAGVEELLRPAILEILYPYRKGAAEISAQPHILGFLGLQVRLRLTNRQ
jgi:hypothetical protein